ncbi:MAG: DUF2508 family protein [Bacillota bacterium]
MKWLEAVRKPQKNQTDEIAEINDALMEWKAAVDYFQQVTDPELVDYAIYTINAAKCRYQYLVRCSKDAARRREQA